MKINALIGLLLVTAGNVFALIAADYRINVLNYGKDGGEQL